MKHVAFGSLGLDVSRMGLGVMPLAIQNRPSIEHATALVRRALDAGINWFDTADSYCLDENDVGYGERFLAETLRAAGSPQVLVMTKGGYTRVGGEWQLNATPDRLKAACEASLKALGVSEIFLYQLHGPDPNVPLRESMGALRQLQREGKIRHIGISNVDLGHLHEAQLEAEIRLVQNRYNLFDPWSADNGVIDYCRARKIPFVAHSPIGGHKGHVRALGSASVGSVAKRRGFTAQQVCLAWVLTQPGVFPIPGATRNESLDANVRVANEILTSEDVAELEAGHPRDKVFKPRLLRARNNLRWLGRSLKRRIG